MATVGVKGLIDRNPAQLNVIVRRRCRQWEICWVMSRSEVKSGGWGRSINRGFFWEVGILATWPKIALHRLQTTWLIADSPLLICCHPSATICIFLITNQQPYSQICITTPVESAPFFIPSTSFCSLFSWFTSSCTHHLITVTTFAAITYHCLNLSLQT